MAPSLLLLRVSATGSFLFFVLFCAFFLVSEGATDPFELEGAGEHSSVPVQVGASSRNTLPFFDQKGGLGAGAGGRVSVFR